MSDLKKANDGEWIKAGHPNKPDIIDHYITCCDCGLTHRYEFKYEDGHIYFRVFRERERTKYWRDNDPDFIWTDVLDTRKYHSASEAPPPHRLSQNLIGRDTSIDVSPLMHQSDGVALSTSALHLDQNQQTSGGSRGR